MVLLLLLSEFQSSSFALSSAGSFIGGFRERRFTTAFLDGIRRIASGVADPLSRQGCQPVRVGVLSAKATSGDESYARTCMAVLNLVDVVVLVVCEVAFCCCLSSVGVVGVLT